MKPLCFDRHILLNFLIYFVQATTFTLSASTGKITLRTQPRGKGFNKQKVGV